MPPAAPMPAASAQAEVTVTSSPPDSIVGEYKIDFAALDKNGDGNLTRAEVKSNATLTGSSARSTTTTTASSARPN